METKKRNYDYKKGVYETDVKGTVKPQSDKWSCGKTLRKGSERSPRGLEFRVYGGEWEHMERNNEEYGRKAMLKGEVPTGRFRS